MVSIRINTSDLGLETEGIVTSTKIVVSEDGAKGLISSPMDCGSLKFPGYASFNNDFMAQLLKVCASEKPFFKVYKVAGNIYGGDSIKTMDIYAISNIKETQFIFNTFSRLGIKLNELRIGIDYEGREHVTLHLNSKVTNMLAKLAPDMKGQLAFFLYCLVKAFDTITLVAPHVVTSTDGTLCVVKEELDKMYVSYGTIQPEFDLDFVTMRDDTLFGEVVYVNNHLTGPSRLPSGIKSSCEYTYNVMTVEGNSVLVIVNKSYTPHEYYLIAPRKGTILTNCVLQPSFTLDFNEWLPNLIVSMKESYPEKLVYRLKFLSNDKLFAFANTDKGVSIGNDASEYEAFLDKYPNITENYNMKLYDDVIHSKVVAESTAMSIEDQYKDDPVAQELFKQVEPYFESFDLKDLTGIVKGFSKGDVYAMLFEGEASSGKTTAAKVIPTRCGMPFVLINCSMNIEESDLFGSLIPNENRKSAEEPEFVWKDGILTMAVRNGYTAVLEEINSARAGVLIACNTLLDESRYIRLSNHEMLKAHPNFRLIATCNIGYEGTNRLNKSLIDRFDICKKFVIPNRSELIKIIESRTGYTDMIKMNKVLDVFDALRKYSKEAHLDLVVSIRELLFLFRNGKYFKNAEEAVENIILNKSFVEEPEHKDFFRTNFLKAMDLSFKL